MADHVGQQLGNYRLMRLLGRGSFTDVYLCEHADLMRKVTFKVLQVQLADDDAIFFAPEKLRNRPLRASDQYSLRVVVYGWLTSSLPFQGTEIERQTMFDPPFFLREKVPTISPDQAG